MTSDDVPNSNRNEPNGAKLTDAATADTTRLETEPWEDVRLATERSITAAAPSCPAPSPKPSADAGRVRPLESGERIDDFEIVRVLGRGAFADVYLARQVSLDRQVALKVAPDRGSEGRTMARLEHDYIVQVFSESVEPSAGCRLLCMQLVPGTSLADIIRQLHGLSSREWTGGDLLEIVDRQATLSESLDPAALRDRTRLAEMDGVGATAWLGGRLAEALDFAHGHGVLHRDIKPANILVNQYGRPMLADFNISFRSCDAGVTSADSFGGTLAFMSPEHLDAFNQAVASTADAVTGQSDIYALGLVLWELLTGKLPFPSGPRQEALLPRLRRMAAERRSARFDLQPGRPDSRKILTGTLGRALRGEPADRFARAADFAEALDGCRQLRKAEERLPNEHALARLSLQRPFLWITILALLPHVAGSIVNVWYNQTQIVGKLSDAQVASFFRLVMIYNAVIYPVLLATFVYIMWRPWRTWRRMCRGEPAGLGEVDAARRQVLRLPLWVAALAAAGWLPGGILFPLLIPAHHVFGHFVVSSSLSGLIALAYAFSGVQYVVLRVLYPRMWDDVRRFSERTTQELAGVPARLTWIQILAGSIPLVAAVLMLQGADVGHPSYRWMITGLIVLGMIGFQMASAASRRLSRTVVALTG